MTDRPFRDEPTEVLETALGLADTHAEQAARFQPAQPDDELPAVASLFRTELQHREGTVTMTNPPDDERRDRYAAAMAKRDGDEWPTELEDDEWPTELEDDERNYRRRADAAIAVADAEIEHLRKERDAFRDQRNGVFATNERLLAQVEESGLARIRAENEVRTVKREAAAPSAPAGRGDPGRYYCDDCDHAFTAPTDTESCICSCGTRAWREKPADADLRTLIRDVIRDCPALYPDDIADRVLAALQPAYRRLLARLEADRDGHLRATEQAKEAGETELLLVSSTFASAFRHATARVVSELEGPDAAQAYMQRTEGGEPVLPADADLRERLREVADRLAAHAKGFQDVLDESDRGPWGRTVGADIDELRALLAALPEPREFDAQAAPQRLADDLQRGETAADSPAPGESYRHYKGGLYTVLAVAEDTGTGAPVVVYHDEHRRVWARPLVEFAGTVTDGVRRFTLEGEPAALPAHDDRATLTPMFEGLARLLATSSRDWGTYRVDAWLYAVLVGWDCEQTEHDETCVHGAMEEVAELHGWDADTVAKARRYRAAVRRMADEAQQAEQECSSSISGNCLSLFESDVPCDTSAGECVHGGKPADDQADRVLDERVAAAKEQPVGLPPQLQAALDVMAKRGRVVELTAGRENSDVVAYRNSDRPAVLLCREHGDGWMGLTPLTSDDLPDGGLCTECGVDVLIPQQQAGEGR